MVQPTIYKPSIYKGNGVYKNGGGGANFYPEIDKNGSYYIEYINKTSGSDSYFQLDNIAHPLINKQKDTIVLQVIFDPSICLPANTALFNAYVKISGQYGYDMKVGGIAADNPNWIFKNGGWANDGRIDFLPPVGYDFYEVKITQYKLYFGNLEYNSSRLNKNYTTSILFRLKGSPAKIFRAYNINEEKQAFNYDLRPFFDATQNKVGLYNVVNGDKLFPDSQSGLTSGPRISY